MTQSQQPIHRQMPSSLVELPIKGSVPNTDECISILRNGLKVFSQKGLPQEDGERRGRIVTMSRFDSDTLDLVDLRQLNTVPGKKPHRIPITYLPLGDIDARAKRPIAYMIEETTEVGYALLDVNSGTCVVLEAELLVEATLMLYGDDEANQRLLQIVHTVIEHTWF